MTPTVSLLTGMTVSQNHVKRPEAIIAAAQAKLDHAKAAYDIANIAYTQLLIEH